MEKLGFGTYPFTFHIATNDNAKTQMQKVSHVWIFVALYCNCEY